MCMLLHTFVIFQALWLSIGNWSAPANGALDRIVILKNKLQNPNHDIKHENGVTYSYYQCFIQEMPSPHIPQANV